MKFETAVKIHEASGRYFTARWNISTFHGGMDLTGGLGEPTETRALRTKSLPMQRKELSNGREKYEFRELCNVRRRSGKTGKSGNVRGSPGVG